MDGQSRTCIEWMCNDEYEPGSFDLTNIMSPPDHESMFHSLMHATPLGGEDWQPGGGLTGLAGSPGAPSAARLPSDAATVTPASLVSLVRQMELTPADQKAASGDTGGAVATSSAAPSLTQAVSDALSGLSGGGDGEGGGGASNDDSGAGGGRGLARVTSASQLSELAVQARPPPRVRRPSISCPNSPPTARRVVGNSFFTPSVFDPDRPAEICRQWNEQHPQQSSAAAAAASTAAMPSSATLATAGGMTGAAPQPPRKSRMKPRPSRLRELNFLAPSSM